VSEVSRSRRFRSLGVVRHRRPGYHLGGSRRPTTGTALAIPEIAEDARIEDEHDRTANGGRTVTYALAELRLFRAFQRRA
jgi:hypothetical protein